MQHTVLHYMMYFVQGFEPEFCIYNHIFLLPGWGQDLIQADKRGHLCMAQTYRMDSDQKMNGVEYLGICSLWRSWDFSMIYFLFILTKDMLSYFDFHLNYCFEVDSGIDYVTGVIFLP